MKFWRNKKIILGVLIGIVVFGTIIAQAAIAAGVQTQSGQEKEVTGLLLTITKLVAQVLTLVAGLVDFATKLGNDVMNLAAVKVGWGIVLNFANLGFVLAIIIIAFATIFRFESYAMKQVLWKLIVAALLVNFSLVIAGAFISVSNTFSDTMIEAALGPGGGNLSNVLANAVSPQKFGQVRDKTDSGFWGNISKRIGDFFEYLAGLVFIVIFSFLIILVFLTLFIMLLVRVIALVFLLVLSPLIWLFWIFPNTQKYWTQWWQEFIRWNFFAPVVFFFVYLAIITGACLDPNQNCPIGGGGTLNSITAAGSADNSAVAAFGETSILGGGFFEHVANLMVVLSLLFGGIYVANKFSIAGGSMGVNLAQGAGKWAQGAVGGMAGRGAKGLGKRILTSGSREEIDQRTGKKTGEITTRGQRIAATLSRVPVLRGVASKISNITSARGRKEEVEKYGKENLANLSNDAIVNQANAKMVFLDPVKASAIGQELAKRGLTDKIDPALTEKYVKTATKLGAEEPILNSRPDLSSDKRKTVNKIKAGKTEEIHYKAFEDVDVVVNLDHSKLERLSKEGSTQQKDAVLNTIKTTLGTALAPIETIEGYLEKTQRGIADAQASGDTGLASQLINDRNRLTTDKEALVNNLSNDQQKLLKHNEFIRNNVNWQA